MFVVRCCCSVFVGVVLLFVDMMCVVSCLPLFIVVCLLFACCLFECVVGSLLFLLVYCRLLFVVRCCSLLFVVCLLFFDRCLLSLLGSRVCCLLLVVCCSL